MKLTITHFMDILYLQASLKFSAIAIRLNTAWLGLTCGGGLNRWGFSSRCWISMVRILEDQLKNDLLYWRLFRRNAIDARIESAIIGFGAPSMGANSNFRIL